MQLMQHFPISILWLMPLVFAILHSLVKTKHAQLATWSLSLYGILCSILGFIATRGAMLPFDSSGQWSLYLGSSRIQIPLQFGLDARNGIFVLLMGLCLPIIFILLRDKTESYPASYYIAANILFAALMGVFTAQSLILFYFFWELALIGAYFWIGLHGETGPEKPAVYSTLIRFVLITVLGSLPMLFSIIVVCSQNNIDPGISGLAQTVSMLDSTTRLLVFCGFLLAFAVKLPLLGLHGWLRDTYIVAPPACRAVLSALMSKMGAFGLLLVLVPAFPQELHRFSVPLLILAVVGIVYGSLVCLGRLHFTDALSYSSLAHLGLIALAAFAVHSSNTLSGGFDTSALSAGLFQVFNHGLIMAFLFSLDSRISMDNRLLNISEVSGLRVKQRRLSAFLLVGLFASASLPGLSNFAGEILVYFSAFQFSPKLTLFAAIGSLITAAALIRGYHHLFLGQPKAAQQAAQANDLSLGESAFATAVVVIWLLLGFYPMLFISPLENFWLAFNSLGGHP